MLPAMSIVRKANRFRGAAIVFSAIAAMVGCGSGTTMSAGERQAIADSIARQVKAAYDLSKPKGLDRGVREARRSLAHYPGASLGFAVDARLCDGDGSGHDDAAQAVNPEAE